jgi:nitrate/nitrite transporter NarK
MTQGGDNMQVRSSDEGGNVGPALRQIPVTWLASLAIGLVGHAITMWVAVEKNIDATVRASVAVQDLAKETRELRVEIGRNNSKDIEHDYKLADHERRLGELFEARRSAMPR